METGSIPAKGLLIMSNCVICNLARLPKVGFDNCTLYTRLYRSGSIPITELPSIRSSMYLFGKMFHTAPFLNLVHAPHCLFLFLVARPLFSFVSRGVWG